MLLFEVEIMIPYQLLPLEKLKFMHLLLHSDDQIEQHSTALFPYPLHSLDMKGKQIPPRPQNNLNLPLRPLKLLIL